MNVQLVFAILILFSVLIFITINWFSLKSELKAYSIFDISFISLFGLFIGARVFAILGALSYYLEKGFRLLPNVEGGESWGDLKYYAPWRLFDLVDGRYLISGAVLGLIAAFLLIYKISNQLKSVRYIADKVVGNLNLVVFLVAVCLLILREAGVLSFNYIPVLVYLGVLALSATISKVGIAKTNTGVGSSVFFILIALGEFIINYIKHVNEGTGIEFNSLVALGILVYGIIQLTGSWPKKEKYGDSYEPVRKASRTESGSPLKYSQSYSARKYGK